MPIRIGRTETHTTLQAHREVWPVVADRVRLEGRDDLAERIDRALAYTANESVRVTWPAADAEAVMDLSSSEPDAPDETP